MDKTNYIHLSSRKLQPGRISRKCGNTCRILAVGHLFPPPSLVSVPLAPAFPQLGSIPRLWFIRNWFESILTTSSQLLLQWEWVAREPWPLGHCWVMWGAPGLSASCTQLLPWELTLCWQLLWGLPVIYDTFKLLNFRKTSLKYVIARTWKLFRVYLKFKFNRVPSNCVLFSPLKSDNSM